MAQRIANWGYVVLAPNVFYRDGSTTELAPAVDMSTQEGREAAGKAAFPRVGRLTPDKALPDIDVRNWPGFTPFGPGLRDCSGAWVRFPLPMAKSLPKPPRVPGPSHQVGTAASKPP
ncbi:hypothetical protein [Arthrobacter globiformis]|uniref:hypothetical protein n=1 Tax=Arthrobacter globiformis TaxID=1665 RepID=UPI0027D7CD3A|nr:hypothetical protein [Arthrobacter globiformis]